MVHRPVPNAISGVTQVASISVIGASAISVQTDGATVYVATEVESFVGLASGGLLGIKVKYMMMIYGVLQTPLYTYILSS